MPGDRERDRRILRSQPLLQSATIVEPLARTYLLRLIFFERNAYGQLLPLPHERDRDNFLARGYRGTQRGELRRFRIWIMATALFGATFIGGQIFEFTEFTRQGLNLDTSTFGSSFYVLTGLHGAHVTVGIVWLISLWGLAMQGRMTQADSERIEVAGLYWHFVDVVWIVIFTVIYLIPK
jgi:hypothetical protein